MIRHFAVSLGGGDVNSYATDKTIASEIKFAAHVGVYLNLGIPTPEIGGLEAGQTEIMGNHENTTVPAWLSIATV